MKKATDPMEYAVQNGRQLALKVSANSVYGFTGATVGQLPCLPIASTTTAYGRELLLQTKAFVEQHYPEATVVYGDTDSVMIKFGAGGVPETMVLARQVAERVTAIFPRPVKLEFEKVYFPYLLMNKKRYAGLLWTQPDKHDYLDAKGLETVRRDNCLLVRQLIDTCLRKIIIDRDTAGAIAHAKKTISNLLQNKIDISLLVISKSLSKLPGDADYKMKSAHAELAARMRERDAGTAPNLGDRVPYVIIQGAKGMPAYEKAEDPVFVLENNLPIDAQHYLDNQLSKPLERIFEPIIRKTSELLHGDHTRVVSKPTPVAKKGGIMMFTQKTLKCLGCKALIDSGTVCAHCKKRERCASEGSLCGCVPSATVSPVGRFTSSVCATWTSTRSSSRGCGRSASAARARCTRTFCAQTRTAPSSTNGKRCSRTSRTLARTSRGSTTRGEAWADARTPGRRIAEAPRRTRPRVTLVALGRRISPVDPPTPDAVPSRTAASLYARRAQGPRGVE
jgi:hypothetical protein